MSEEKKMGIVDKIKLYLFVFIAAISIIVFTTTFTVYIFDCTRVELFFQQELGAWSPPCNRGN